MQIDFHESKMKVQTRHPRSVPKVPVVVKRLFGIALAILGIIFIVVSVLSLLTRKSDTPYAVMIFEQQEKNSPHAHATILWVNETKGTVQLTRVPDALEFHSQSLGTYPMESIYAAHQSTRQSTADFLTDMSYFFRFPIKSYVFTTTPVVASGWSLGMLTLRTCLTGTASTTVGECMHLSVFFQSLGTTVRDLSFPQSALGTGSLETLKPLDRTKYREWSQSHFSESFKSWNKYTVAVLNGTKTSGLAAYAANIISDFGLTVLYIGETQSPQANGEVVLSTELHRTPAIETFLKSALQLPIRIDDSMPTQYRSDIVIVIGEKEKKFFEN